MHANAEAEPVISRYLTVDWPRNVLAAHKLKVSFQT